MCVHQLLWYLRTTCLLIYELLQPLRLQETQNRTLMTLNQHMKEITKCNTPQNSHTVQVWEQ
jgi:chaperone required for assembly of F1-ATPase